MSEGEIDAEMLAIEREIDKLEASINKSQLKPVARDSRAGEQQWMRQKTVWGKTQDLNQLG